MFNKLIGYLISIIAGVLLYFLAIVIWCGLGGRIGGIPFMAFLIVLLQLVILLGSFIFKKIVKINFGEELKRKRSSFKDNCNNIEGCGDMQKAEEEQKAIRQDVDNCKEAEQSNDSQVITMDNLITISENGIIRILGIQICTPIEYVKQHLEGLVCVVKKKSLLYDKIQIGDFPLLSVEFVGDNNGRVCTMYVYKESVNTQELYRISDFINQKLKDSVKAISLVDNGHNTYSYTDALYIIREHRLNMDSCDGVKQYCMEISGTLLSADDGVLTKAQNKLYRESCIWKKENRKDWMSWHIKINSYRIFKCVLATCLLLIAFSFVSVFYLYVLNGRYQRVGREEYFDKWAGKVVRVEYCITE